MAKPVHKDSNDCSSSSLDLFLLPPTQSSFQKGKSIDYHPITSLSDGGPIEFKVFTLPRGQQSQHIDNAFLGEIPKRIAICMMDNDSYNGNYKKNPFNFQHYNLTQIGISVNGEEVPFKPLKLNFDDKLFVTACLQHFILRYRKTSWK